MRLLVTGGMGFIGSNFILYALENFPKIRVTNLDAMLIGSNRRNLEEVSSDQRYRFVKGNINNKRIIQKLISQNDAVVNFAAETHVDRSIDDAKPFLMSNVFGVHTILEEIVRSKKKLVHISTDEVYGSLKSGSATEDSRFAPSNPYSASKAAAELLIHSYIKTHDCDVNITRCTNNFGPRQSPEKLIPKVITLAERNQRIPIYGSGKNIRDWIFVSDHCEAIMKVILKGRRGESYNIAGKNELDNTTIVKKILNLMGKSLSLIEYTKDRPGHDFRYSLNSTKITRNLKWRPAHSFEDGLQETIDWYQKNRAWWKNTSKIATAYSWKTR